ncbi:uncharacterized protein N7477_005223 [Penicillium maclennaniae]|uniref:uncharacterized protein n=1 Tax=Penicillium maclennaniae TaxID=1343394 RepID=UPI002541B78C|nr:uncharacterized protein N7477_005223 [Penicillium maclennaniae]KAJ5675289.1 hypothetical protein N7477_005223 [Penicillium maclennaniae]
MNYDLPSVTELKQAVESGQRITREDVSVISHAESALTGRGPLRGGPAALAQSLAMRQMNFDNKVDEVSRKPQSHITQNDARAIQSIEGRAFNRPPGIGSVTAQWRQIPPVYVTKDDARKAQRAEAMLYGGYISGQGMAASMQSAADKIDHVYGNL